jgi:hypothetical protein
MNDDIANPIPTLEGEIADLSRRYRRANGPVISLVNRMGGGLEKQLAQLPVALRARVGQVTETALVQAWTLADRSAKHIPDPGRRGTLAAAMVTGAAGGAGGIATSLAELPVTVTMILHAIRAEAVAAGHDPSDAAIRAECLRVFAAGSPLAEDDGIDAAFLSARLTMTGPALQALIASVAPKLATALTQKLAAQAVPILGAVSGAALNAAYLSYYREIASIRFALLRLGFVHGETSVLEAFRIATTARPITQA